MPESPPRSNPLISSSTSRETKHSKYLGKTSRYAIAAAALAIKDAGLELEKIERQKGDSSGQGGQYLLKGIDPFQAGVILGVGAEAMEKMESYHEKFMQGTRGLSPFGLPNSYLSSFTSHVAQCFSLKGTSYAVSTACASATHAMINSFIHIQSGREDIMVTGGADACLTPFVFMGFDILRAMSARNHETRESLPPL